jgi:hypothetical protein
MRRVRVLVLLLAVALATGCSRTSAPETTAAATPQVSSTTGVSAPGGVSYQVAVTARSGAQPLAAADLGAQAVCDDRAISDALATSFPASIAANEGEYVLGDHLIVVLDIAGAARTETGTDVYATVWAQWFSLAGWQPVQGSGSIYPATIRLATDGAGFRLDGVQAPQDGEGYVESLARIMPDWARAEADTDEARSRMRDALWSAASEWVKPHVPADLFVDQSPSTTPDAHGHEPPSSEYKMLAAHYIDCKLTATAAPPFDSYQPQYAVVSEDGRFRLHFLLDGRGMAVEDTQSATWRLIEAPGESLGAVDGTAGFDPTWSGHTLFIDLETIIDPYEATLTHYEIDFDSMTVIRAVPMGPLSFNEPMQ